MSRQIGNVFISYAEVEQVCEFCGKISETRPYGKDGKEICYECSEKPENKEEVEKNMVDYILGKKRMPMRNDISSG